MPRRYRTGDERGAALVMVALCMVVLLGMAALAVDLAAAFAWRTEAQKIADSAALAGGSAYIDNVTTETDSAVAHHRAYEYALLHTIKKEQVDSSEVGVEIFDDDRKVRVWISRPNMPTWFARVLGIDAVTITAMAAAQVSDAGVARCLKPIALPDMWEEANSDDGDQVWEAEEEWEYDPTAGDRYQRWNGPEDPDAGNATGYGSNHRTDLTGDWGRVIQLKAQNPQSEYNFAPGIFFPWRLPIDDGMGDCDSGGGGGEGQESGGAVYRKNLCECNTSPVELFVDYDVEPGNMVGPTQQGIGELIAEDPDIQWRQELNGGDGAPARQNDDGDWIEVSDSPRIIKVAMMDPGEIQGSGMQTIQFNNFALVFLEEQVSGQGAPVNVRFMYYAGGSGEGTVGPAQGSLVRYLRLVE